MNDKKIQIATYHSLMLSNTQNPTPPQKLIPTLHSLNLYNGLICIDDDSNQCEFPVKWHQDVEGVFKINYRVKDSKDVVRFRFVQNGDQGMNICFVREGQEELQSVSLEYKLEEEQVIKKYEEFVKKVQSKKEQEKPKNTNRLLVQGFHTRPPNNNPNPSFRSNDPFNGGEYVGPESNIFKDRFEGQNQGGSLRAPFGARYDKVDPFDDPLRQKPKPGQFFGGFDEFGRPNGGFGGGGFNGGFGGGGFNGGFGGGSNGGFFS